MAERLYVRLDGDPACGPETTAPAGTLAAAPIPAALRPYVSGILAYREDLGSAEILHEALSRRLARTGRALDRAAQHAAGLITTSGGRIALSAVADAAGVGERRLQQLFHAHVGLSPRAFRRLSRMHALLRALRESPYPRWAQLAADSGFYDQAHLANEFRALSGLTPTDFLQRVVSGSSKTAD